MDKIIYVSHKYGSKAENKQAVEKLIKKLVRQYPQYCFVSPIHALGFLYNEMDYDTGMEHCLTLLDVCDEMWICSEDSKGVKIEREYCNRYKIPVIEYKPDVEMVDYFSCSECAKRFDILNAEGEAELIKERSKLMRCRGCWRITNAH